MLIGPKKMRFYWILFSKGNQHKNLMLKGLIELTGMKYWIYICLAEYQWFEILLKSG